MNGENQIAINPAVRINKPAKNNRFLNGMKWKKGEL